MKWNFWLELGLGSEKVEYTGIDCAAKVIFEKMSYLFFKSSIFLPPFSGQIASFELSREIMSNKSKANQTFDAICF